MAAWAVTVLKEVHKVDQPTHTHVTCPDCRALVADLDAHEAWHSRLVADLANAVEAEIRRSTTG